LNIAAYCRVSTDKKEQQESLLHQKEFFTEYARRNGHILVRLYADEGISGTSLKKRDEFRRLLDDARLGLFEVVVVKDVSRFARNTVDALQSVRTLKALGINTLFINANMTSIGDGEFALTLFSAMAQEESNNLSKRVKWGKRINAEKGRVPPRVFGYDKMDNFTLAINEEEARIVRKVFSLYIDQGLGCRSISMALNRDGDQTKLGNAWDARGVKRLLSNPLYGGILVNHKYEIEDFLTGRQVALPEEERFYHQRPEWAIVPPERFRRAQEILASRRRQYASGEPFREGRYSGKHPFSTLIKCAHCGRSFCRKSYTYQNTRVYWRCVTNDQYTAETCDNPVILDEKELLEALRQYFSARIGDREAFIEKTLAQLNRRLPGVDPAQSRRELQAKQKRLLQKRSRWQELYANDLLTIEELRERLTALDRELQEVARQMDAPEPPGSDAGCSARIGEFLTLQTATNADLRRLIDRITVSRDGNVQVVLRKLDGAA
jgi:DNA invertase Pin-like site-specific DNA recombinase